MGKKLQFIEVYSTISGPTWAGYVGTMERKIIFTPEKQAFSNVWHGLRPAMLALVKCGDFQHATIDSAWMEVHWTEKIGRRSVSVSISNEIVPGKLISDLFTQEG
jgi:hypothetical protein